tara:strand:- start:874 stop:1392 length:519 start_codon:yes stop_codon:yes gene_type:complete
MDNTDNRYNHPDKISLILDIKAGIATEFSIHLIDPLKLDRDYDIYLESFTTFRCKSSNNKSNIGFIIYFDQWNIKTMSNNSFLNQGLFIPNEQSKLPPAEKFGPPEGKIHNGKVLNYITTVQPEDITNISGKITLLDGISTIFDTVPQSDPPDDPPNSEDGRCIIELLFVAK